MPRIDRDLNGINRGAQLQGHKHTIKHPSDLSMPPRNNPSNEHRMSQDERAGSFYRLSKNLSEFDIEKLSWLELQVLAQDTGFSESQVVEHALMLAPNARFPKDISSEEEYGYECFREPQRTAYKFESDFNFSKRSTRFNGETSTSSSTTTIHLL